jgi:predicted lipid-binding transport protein (Tim44 family)
LGAGGRPIKQAGCREAGSTPFSEATVQRMLTTAIFGSVVLPPGLKRPIFTGMNVLLGFWANRAMARSLANWRIILALFFCASVALAPAIAEARAGASAGGRASSMGSRGLRTYENNNAQPLTRSMTPLPQTPAQPGLAPAVPAYGGGSFFQQHPFLTGLAGGFLGSWLFGHSGYAADGASAGSAMGTLLEFLIIGVLIYFALRLFRGRAFSNGWPGGTRFSMPRSVGASAAPVRRDRGRDINLSDADLSAFQTLHAAVQEAWSAGDLGRLRQLMTPEMLSYFSEELTRSASQRLRNIVSDVQLVKGELIEGWEQGDLQYATAFLRWRAHDYVIRLGHSPDDAESIVSGNPRVAVEAEEMWTFVRRRGGGNWLLSAIQQV